MDALQQLLDALCNFTLITHVAIAGTAYMVGRSTAGRNK